jgi:hypothetical protein
MYKVKESRGIGMLSSSPMMLMMMMKGKDNYKKRDSFLFTDEEER